MTRHSHLHNLSLPLMHKFILASLQLALSDTRWTKVPVRPSTEKVPENLLETAVWGNGHIKEQYMYYNYVKENNTSYTIKYINSDWYEINLNEDRKFYTKPSLRLRQEDT